MNESMPRNRRKFDAVTRGKMENSIAEMLRINQNLSTQQILTTLIERGFHGPNGALPLTLVSKYRRRIEDGPRPQSAPRRQARPNRLPPTAMGILEDDSLSAADKVAMLQLYARG